MRGLGTLALLAACGGEAAPGAIDAAACVAPPLELLSTAPARLSATGFPGGELFEPRFVLWSDGLEKERRVWLPPCSTIETGDVDHWSLPVGTRLWKTFSLEGRKIETRLIARFGPGPDDFLFAAYLWNDDESDADFAPDGVRDARGTTHDVPSTEDCRSCHAYLPERALGFSAIQLAHDRPGVTLAGLIAAGRLSAPPATPVGVPGDAATQEALGYLHANCGNCHNDRGVVFVRPFGLRLSVSDRRPEDTAVYRTAVAVPVEKFVWPGVLLRIAPGQPEASCVIVRTGERGGPAQMPPLGSEAVDAEGRARLAAWIAGLPERSR